MSDMLPSIPVMDDSPDAMISRLNGFLDRYVLPWPVKYLTNRVTILATLCLLIPLIALATNQVFVLLANSYLNVMSVVVSSTVLLYSTIAEARDRSAAQRREQIAAAHQQQVDMRAEEDHQRIEEISAHIDDIHQQIVEHVTTSLDNIQKLLIERLEQMQQEDHTQISENSSEMLARIAAQKAELADVRQMIESMRPAAPPAN